MNPGLKTFLKTLVGVLSAALAGFLVDPSHYVQFGSLAVIFASVGAFLASLLEKVVLARKLARGRR